MKKIIIVVVFFQLLAKVSYSQDHICEYTIDTIFSMNEEKDIIVKKKTTIRNKEEFQLIVSSVKIFNKSGVLKEKFLLDQNECKNGYFFSYYDNGNLKEEAFYIRDRLAGLYIKYYPNEIIEQIGFYKSEYCNINEYAYECIQIESYDEVIGGIVSKTKSIPKAIKQGKWLFYDISGNLKRIEEYNEFGEILYD